MRLHLTTLTPSRRSALPATPQRRNGSHGFTLLEVMLAMMILGVSLVAIFQVFGQGVAMTAAAEDTTFATLLGRSKMGETLRQPFLDEGSDSGTFDEFNRRFSYEVSIAETELTFLQEEGDLDFGTTSAVPGGKDEPLFKVYKVTVVITWNEGNKRVTFESLRTDYNLPESGT